MSHKTKRILLNGCISLAVIAICVVTLKATRGSRVFKKYVCNPIPKSVKDIKVHRLWELSGHRYVMHFKISKADLELILSSRRFKEMMDFTYRNGILHVTVDAAHGESLPVFLRQRAPEWFRPDNWDNPKVYRFKERDIEYREQMQILIYNDKLGEAYFVERKEGYW